MCFSPMPEFGAPLKRIKFGQSRKQPLGLSRLSVSYQPVLKRARAIYFGLEEERWKDLQERVYP